MGLGDVKGDVVEEGGEVGDEGELVGAEDEGGLFRDKYQSYFRTNIKPIS